MSDTSVRNLEALRLGTGEFSFAPGATSVATARTIGYLDFGNITATGVKPSMEKVEHEGSYRGVRRVDRQVATKGDLKYTVKTDEWDQQKLLIALMGTAATGITQSAQATPVVADSMAFNTTPAVIGRWYDILYSGAQVRELLTCCVPAAAAVSCTVADATDVFTASTHGLLNGDEVMIGGTPPTGFTAGTRYYVRDKDTNTFKLAASLNGTAVDATSAGTSVTFTKLLVEGTGVFTDTKIGRIRFAAAQAIATVPYFTCSAITSADAAGLKAITPLQSLVRSGFGRLAIFDDTHPNKLVYLHEGFSCQVSLDSASDSSGKEFDEMTLTVQVTDTVGTVFCAE